MRLTLTTLTCDLCAATHTHREAADPPEWATASLPMGGRPNVAAICPACVANLIDPADDCVAEVRRFALERAIA